MSPGSGNIILSGLVMATARPPASSSRLSSSFAIASTVPYAAAAQISRAARSEIASTAACTGPVVIAGITDASATHQATDAVNAEAAIDDGGARIPAHRAGSHGVVVGHGGPRDEASTDSSSCTAGPGRISASRHSSSAAPPPTRRARRSAARKRSRSSGAVR